jgi:hypothetical protein
MMEKMSIVGSGRSVTSQIVNALGEFAPNCLEFNPHVMSVENPVNTKNLSPAVFDKRKKLARKMRRGRN